MAAESDWYIDPIITTGERLEVQQQILDVLEEFENAQVVVIEEDYIRAEFTSSFFKFVDDVEFYFPGTESEDFLIHIRSASRVGKSNFGVNRKRMEEIREKFQKVEWIAD